MAPVGGGADVPGQVLGRRPQPPAAADSGVNIPIVARGPGPQAIWQRLLEGAPGHPERFQGQ